jgi:hypothetical protein
VEAQENGEVKRITAKDAKDAKEKTECEEPRMDADKR